MQTGMDYKTGGRSNYKKEWNQISLLYPYIQTNAQVGIQTEGTKKDTYEYRIKRRERTF